jgi:hypothetical protein
VALGVLVLVLVVLHLTEPPELDMVAVAVEPQQTELEEMAVLELLVLL